MLWEEEHSLKGQLGESKRNPGIQGWIGFCSCELQVERAERKEERERENGGEKYRKQKTALNTVPKLQFCEMDFLFGKVSKNRKRTKETLTPFFFFPSKWVYLSFKKVRNQKKKIERIENKRAKFVFSFII